MRRIGTAIAGALACAALGAWAQAARVEAVQYPAWLERGGHAVPLKPGMALQPRDRLRTGDDARVQLRLSEGGSVKLGERATFVVERAQDRGGFFRATLAVIAGAVRYTGRALGAKREIDIRVKNTTAGIRGTDVWARAADEREIVCLIEGRVEVGTAGHPPMVLDHPLDFYDKRPGEAPRRGRVDRKQIDEWIGETELAAEGPVGRIGGKWRVVAAVFASRDTALRLNRELRARGYPSELGRQERYFSVLVPGLGSEAQARALMAALRGIPGVELPLVREAP